MTLFYAKYSRFVFAILIISLLALCPLKSSAFVLSLSNHTVPTGKTLAASTIRKSLVVVNVNDDINLEITVTPLGRFATKPTTTVLHAAAYPDSIIPLSGSESSFCATTAIPSYPCAIFGFFNTNSDAMWIASFNSTSAAVPVTSLRSVPFSCSAAYPCGIRTAEASDGVEGGCYEEALPSTNADTLVVVSWNRTYYIFRPTLYFAGFGAIYVKAFGVWPDTARSTANYELGLRFDTMVGLNNDSSCVLSIVHGNGTVELFLTDLDDPKSTTGLASLAQVAPTITSPYCLPTVQFVASPITGSVLSVTCISGYSWLWALRVGSNSTLVGEFGLAPPSTTVTAEAEGTAIPMIVDIKITMIQVAYCEVASVVTTVAFVGRGYLEPVPSFPPDDENPDESVITFTTLLSEWYFEGSQDSLWLTQYRLSESIAPQSSYAGMFLRTGLGWVLPPSLPAQAANLSYTEEQCAAVVLSVSQWFAMNAFYSAVSANYALLIDAVNGALVSPTPFEIINGTTLYGGGLYAGAVLLGATTAFYTRVFPSYRGIPALLQVFFDGSEPTLLMAAELALYLTVEGFPAYAPDASWSFQPIAGVPIIYSPKLFGARYLVPITSSSPKDMANYLKMMWLGDYPVFYTRADKFLGEVNSTTIALLTVCASASSMPNSVGFSLLYSVTEIETSIYSANSPQNVQVCIGNEFYFIDSMVKDPLAYASMSDQRYCSSGSCGCSNNSFIFTTTSSSYLSWTFVSFFDNILGTYGIAIFSTFDGIFLTAFQPADVLSLQDSSTCGILESFGDVTEILFLIPEIGYAIPMIGTRCVLHLRYSSTVGYVWAVVVITGEPVSVAANAASVSEMLMISEQQGPDVAAGANLFGFSLITLQNVFQLNQHGGVGVFGVCPEYVLSSVKSYVIFNEVVISLVVISPTEFQFVGNDLLTGFTIWKTNITQMNDESAWQYMQIFLVNHQRTTLACVAFGRFACISAATAAVQEMFVTPEDFGAFGAPLGEFNNSMIWVTEGKPVVSVSKDFVHTSWRGISQSPTSLAYPVNQTSCTDGTVSNQGLLVRCSRLGSSTMHLHLIDARTGQLLLGNGPQVDAARFSITVNGESINAVDHTTMTFYIISLGTDAEDVTLPLSMTLCAGESNSRYVLAITKDGYTATLVPFPGDSVLPPQSIIQRNYSNVVTLTVSNVFADLFSISLDGLAFVPHTQSLISALDAALLPAVVAELTLSGVYISTSGTPTVTDPTGSLVYMSSGYCDNCYFDCPALCALDTVTGVQKQYLAENNDIVSYIKPPNGTSFNYSLLNATYPIVYSGSPAANKDRFIPTLPYSEQVIPCLTDSNSQTTLAASGRYCLAVDESVWSVIDIEAGNRSQISTFTSSGSSHLGRPAWYSGYAVWTDREVFQVEQFVGLTKLLTMHTFAIPTKGMASAVVSVTLTDSDILSVNTDLVELRYSSALCEKVLMNFPVCPSQLTVLTKAMIDDSIATISWMGGYGSNWGNGFVAVGYPVKIATILRDVQNSAAPTYCAMEGNQNPACATVCQPSSDCRSQFIGTFASYLSLLSWLPSGSILNTTNGPCEFPSSLWELPARFYATDVKHEIIITIEIEGSEIIVYSSVAHAPSVFGVKFSRSQCVFFLLPEVVAQPYSWLAINSVKSLILTICFYLLERKFRERERRRNSLSVPFSYVDDPISSEAVSREVDKEEKVKEESLPLTETQKTPAVGFSLFRSIVSVLVTLCGFRNPWDRISQKRHVVDNFLPRELTEEDLVELLMSLLQEDSRDLAVVRSFALFYEMSLCDNRYWVIRHSVVESVESCDRLNKVVEGRLECIKGSLRRLYKVYKASSPAIPYDIQSSTIELGSTRSRATPTVHATEGDTSELENLVAEFNTFHDTDQNCFEYAILSSRVTEEQLRPSNLLLALSMFQSFLTVIVYGIDVHLRSKSTPLSPVQVYECICFMVFNSSLPATLLVNSVLHADLTSIKKKDSGSRISTFGSWFAQIIQSPFVIISLLLLAPPLVTHVIPGLILFGWALLPPIGLVIYAEYLLRNTFGRSTLHQVAMRVSNRFAILLVVAITFSVAFNTADGYLWKHIREDKYPTGSYVQQKYIGALEQDYNDRSLACAWEHLLTTVSNFLQAGFFFV